MKPSQGRTIITKGVVASNGSDEHAAIVTCVFSDKDPAIEKDEPIYVNCTVLPDLAAPYPQATIRLFETRQEAEAEQARFNVVGNNGDMFRMVGLSGPMVAFWPDRV